MTQTSATPLAIIGIGCLFPKAEGVEQYWANVREGVDAISEVPKTHWDPADHYDPDPNAADMVYGRRGGFLDPIDFSPLDFGMAPRDIEATDTTQLLSLHVAAKALEDAGYGPGGKKIDRDRVGVVLGVTGALELVIPLGARLGHPIWRRALAEAGVDEDTAADVVERISSAYVPWQENSFPGLLGNVAAGRIANRLDLHGTNCVVDAACASSLSALHLAALELESERADLVLAGGVDTFNDVFMYACFSKTPALSPSGDIRPFDHAADGTILGEGVGIVAIKRLRDAQRDGDQVYAVIRGIGTSSDGKGQAIYAPDAEGQARAMRNAYRVAGVSPGSVRLVEAHGTGTKVGDATELRGLRSVFDSEGSTQTPFCALGSVKSMIGHTKAAAGVAGLIKTALALRHRVLPPTIKVDRPSEAVDDEGPFYVNHRKRPWLRSSAHPRRAGVSAFGFGGSNFHCVLEEAPLDTPDDDGGEPEGVDWDGRTQILAFGARTREELASVLDAIDPPTMWKDLRRLASRAREQFDPAAHCRITIVLTEEDDLGERIAAALLALRNDDRPRWSTPRGIAFGEGVAGGKLGALFPGQGAQATDMLADVVCQFPAMRRAVEDLLGELPEVAEALYPQPAFDDETRARQEVRLRETQLAQPALGAVSLGAYDVLRSFDVHVDAAVGHSFGELAALCAAGRLDRESLATVSRRRGELMAEGEGDRGSMLAVSADLSTLQARVEASHWSDLTIANRNAPRQMVLSGPTESIDRAAKDLADEGIGVRRLSVAAAFHSPMVAAATVPFAAALESIDLPPAAIEVYANASGAIYPSDPGAARAVLAEQIASPVLFIRCVEAMVAEGVTTFIEIGPGRRLGGLVAEICANRFEAGNVVVTAIDGSAGRRHGVVDLARALASLAAWGHRVNLRAWDPQPRAEAVTKKKLQLRICGANAKPTAKPRPPREPVARPKSQPMSQPPPIPTPAAPVAIPTSIDARASLDATQANLAALMRLQEQTADLHRRFLEGQEQATRTFGALVAQHQSLLAGVPLAAVPSSLVTVPSTLAAVPPLASPSVVPLHAPAVAATAAQVSISTPASASPAITLVPAPVTPAPASPAPGSEIAAVLLGVVAEKTGYPTSMLEMSMGLDADLGIDSIKRVEILSALAERLPQLPKIGPEQLGELQTLGQIVEYLGGSDGAVVPPSSPEAAAEIATTLLAVVADKTGYPAEMLELEMGLDADLGIDSIKRVEILSTLAEKLPNAPTIGPEQLGELRTLGEIVAYLGGEPTTSPAVAAAPPPVAIAPAPTIPEPIRGRIELDRHELHFSRDVELGSPLELARGPIVVTGPDERRVPIASVLRDRGLDVVDLAWDQPLPSELGGLVFVAPGQAGPRFATEALAKLREASKALRTQGAPKSLLACVTWLGGSFALQDVSEIDPCGAALLGMIKTAAREWPEVVARALDLPLDATEAVLERGSEALVHVGPLEIGCDEQGLGTPRLEQRKPSGLGVKLGSEDVILVTGGARGVTARVAIEIARSCKATLVLVGRSPEPGPPPTWLEKGDGEAEVRRKLAAQTEVKRTPKELGMQCTRILAEREIRATLQEIEELGGVARYRSVDVRDRVAIEELIESTRQDLGPISVLIHGAGVLADKRIEDKSDVDVDRVYGTKVEGLLNLLGALDQQTLRALVSFSSSTARFGRIGQSDYAMANEVLNKLGQHFASRHPQIRVASIGWGPWDGGMVTPALAKIFHAEGVATIDRGAGARFVLEELSHGGPVETVVVGAGSRLEQGTEFSTAFERELSVHDHPFLASHVLSGKAVLPTVMMLEWFAHAALAEHPGLSFIGLDELRVFKGVRLGRDDRHLVRVEAGSAIKRDGRFEIPVALCSGGTNGQRVVHARANVVLGTVADDAPQAEMLSLPPTRWSADRAYAEVLFHGERFRGLHTIEGVEAEGIVVRAHGAPKPREWMASPLRRRWVTDPLAIDAGLQAMIVWTSAQAGGASLPNRFGCYRQFDRFPREGTTVAVRIQSRSDNAVAADLDWVDAEGKVVARLTGCEFTIDAGLRSAFSRNQME